MSGAVTRFGFVRGVGVSSMPNPRVNLTGEPYVTDGLRLVLFLNEPRQPFNQIDFLDWERVSPWQSPRLQRFNSIDPNADSIMVAFPTGTFLDAAKITHP